MNILDVMRRVLPVVAAMAMGSLSRQQGASLAGAAPGGLLGMLTPLVDQNRNGSVLDDVAGLAGRLFGGRGSGV